jgi:hypothetical protein
MQHANECMHCLLSTTVMTSKALNLQIFSVILYLSSFFLSFVFLIMVTTMEPAATSLGWLFKGPDEVLCSSWIGSVPTGWTNTYLHHLVVSSGTLHAAKSRDMYGHFRMAMQMNKTDGPYYHKDHTLHLTLEGLALNMLGTMEAEGLIQLCTSAVGGILLFTQLPGPDGVMQPAFITVLAAPSVATYAQGLAIAGPI